MKNRVYLDHNATSFLHPTAREMMCNVMKYPTNPSSSHKFGQYARNIIEISRMKLLESVGANKNEYDCLFLGSGTEANNLVINSCHKYSTIITCSTEHPSILLCAKNFKNNQIVEVDSNGLICLKKLEQVLYEYKNSCSLLSVMIANNETGVLQPIQEIAKLAKKYNFLVHSDGSQAFGKISINVDKLGLDYLTISSHKAGGPLGIAALIVRKGCHIFPQIIGGGQERGLRGGTENVPAIAGFGAIATIIPSLLHMMDNVKIFRDNLEQDVEKHCSTAKIFGKNADRLPNTSMLSIPGLDSQFQVISLDLQGFAVSTGSACSSAKLTQSYVLEAMNANKDEIKGAIRVSMGWFTKETEILDFSSAWKNMYKNNGKNYG